MRDTRHVTATYYIESDGDPSRAAALLAGEQSSGTFVDVPNESDRIREQHGAQVRCIRELGSVPPSLPSRSKPERVTAAEILIEFPVRNVGTDLATLITMVAGNLFELGGLYACRLQALDLPEEFTSGHPGPAYGVGRTRDLIDRPTGALIGTIVKPNVGLVEDEFRSVVRELAMAGIDFIKDDELMTNPSYLPLETRVRVATEEIRAAEQMTGKSTMFAFNITGDLAGLRSRHDFVVEAGGTCVMLNVPIMGIPALELLRSFAAVPIHAHRAGLAGAMRHPALGVDYRVWQKFARLAGADHIHVSGLGSKFYERDEQVTANIRSLQESFGPGESPLPTLSSGQNVGTIAPTYQALESTDLLMLAGGGIAAHPGGPTAGVRSLRQAWDAAIGGRPLSDAARSLEADGDPALAQAAAAFGAAR